MRSHSMETMVSSQKKQHGGGIPGSLSGGITHNSVEVTKTTFSVRAAGPGVARGTWGGSSRPQCGRVEPGPGDLEQGRRRETKAVWGVSPGPASEMEPASLGLAQPRVQYSCLENPRDGGVCWASVYGVTQSRT